jgi:outer membrane protein assembly factor BamB
VFSTDDRLYRPVARLCHELLASLPPQGLSLYRARYGFVAEKAYVDALASRDLTAMESVYTKYFITKHAGLAMHAAADLLMDRGRFRAAIQTMQTLLEVYPEFCRREAGLQDVLLWVKLATCYEQLGESKTAVDVLEQVTARWPEASVRIMGDLYPVASLTESELFGARNVATDRHHTIAAARLDLGAQDLSLVSMWEFRFTDMQPYEKVRQQRSNTGYITMSGSGTPTGYPRVEFSKPGTSVHFLPGRIAFKDHYRLVVRDLRSGLLHLHTSTISEILRPGGGPDVKQRKPRANMPRARLPVYDHFGQRVVHDAQRFYVLEGSRSSPSNSMKVLTDTRLRAYDRNSGEELWSSDKIAGTNKAGRTTGDVYKSLTFLTVPTLFRKNLLVPFMDRGAYGLMCMESASAKEIYRVYLHSAGTDLARAPTVPVKLNSGIAYVLTNAGVLSAIDAHTGVLVWSRKYERAHPLRYRTPRRSPVTRGGFGFRGVHRQARAVTLKGSFHPAELQIVEDRVIFSPTDGKVLLCLDGASGEPLWMLSKEHRNMPKSILEKMTYVIGRDDDFLYVMCDGGQVLCVDFRSGSRLWAARIPGSGTVGNKWYGRGIVTDRYVVVPGPPESRRLYVLPTRGQRTWRTLDLPAFGVSKEALKGPFNLQLEGSYLAVCYEGGIELFSSTTALIALAEEQADPKGKAAYLVHAGQRREAIKQLQIALTDRSRSARERTDLARRVLTLAGEVAVETAKKDRAAALAVLDNCKAWLDDPQIVAEAPRLRRRWHLARLDVFRVLRDIQGIEREQDIIELGGSK